MSRPLSRQSGKFVGQPYSTPHEDKVFNRVIIRHIVGVFLNPLETVA